METQPNTPPNNPSASLIPTDDAAPQKTVMSAKELSWHETIAGIRAKQAAQAEGTAPSAIENLLEASTKKEIKVGPITLKRATKGTALVLRTLAIAYHKWLESNPLTEEEADMIGDGIATLVFMDSEAAHHRYFVHGIEPLISDADLITNKLDLDDLKIINEHVKHQMDRIKLLNEAMNGGSSDDVPGKPPQAETEMPDGHSEKNQTPPLEMTSPASNGSCQNTGSVSMPPSGNSPSRPPSSFSPPETSGTDVTQAQATPPTPASTHAPDAVNS